MLVVLKIVYNSARASKHRTDYIKPYVTYALTGDDAPNKTINGAGYIFRSNVVAHTSCMKNVSGPNGAYLSSFINIRSTIGHGSRSEKHGKINCLTGNGSVSFRVFPWQGLK